MERSRAQIQAEIEALEAQLSSGAEQVRHGEKSISYRSQEEIERQIARLNAQLASPRRVVYVRTV